jgi:hypothetical protein
LPRRPLHQTRRSRTKIALVERALPQAANGTPSFSESIPSKLDCVPQMLTCVVQQTVRHRQVGAPQLNNHARKCLCNCVVNFTRNAVPLTRDGTN